MRRAHRRSSMMSGLHVLAAAWWAALAFSATLWAGAVPATQPVNLVPNGDFEDLEPGGVPLLVQPVPGAEKRYDFAVTTLPAGARPVAWPAGWATRRPQNVKLVDLGPPRGRAVEMTGDAALMGTYGVDLISPRIAFKSNTRYRCTGWTRSAGPNLIVFVKGYAQVTRTVEGQNRTFDDQVYQMRKEIAPTRDWTRFNLDFEVKPVREFSDFQHRIQYLRVTLWAYWPKGTCWYDGIRFEEVGEVAEKDRLHGAAVTHIGAKPRLLDEVNPAAAMVGGDGRRGRGDQPLEGPPPTQSAVDFEQTWLDAVNAWKAEEYAKAAKLAEDLLATASPAANAAQGRTTGAPGVGLAASGRADYRLLAARAWAKLEQWDRAQEHGQWLLEEPDGKPRPEVLPWHRDWARVVVAEVRLQRGKPDEAKALLRAVLDAASSDHAKQAAQELLARMGQQP